MRWILAAVLLVSLVVTLAPESPAIPLTAHADWELVGSRDAALRLGDYSPAFRHARDSVATTNPRIFRNWTPGVGQIALQASSPPFEAPPYLSVLITGSAADYLGATRVQLRCLGNDRALDIFHGDVNINASEALLVVPPGWCTGNARIELASSEPKLVGVGDAFAISPLSYFKRRLFGLLAYAAVAFAAMAGLVFAGAVLAARFGVRDNAIPVGLLTLGATAFMAFIATAFVRVPGALVFLAVLIFGVGVLIHGYRRSLLAEAWREMRPALELWSLVALASLALLYLDDPGSGHWIANNRFWPAGWSSDNELPWLYAEGIRRGLELKGMLGAWTFTDRPPLMTGIYLLLAPTFDLMQAFNDGPHLRPHAYGAAAVVINSSWVLAATWLARCVLKIEPGTRLHAVIAFVWVVPFILFNTVYGWPKALSATFCLAAAGIAIQAWISRQLSPLDLFLVLTLGLLGFLTHGSSAIFLLPIGLLLLPRMNRRNLAGGVLALATALVFLGAWTAYQRMVLPSANPLMKYALTGDFGFSSPETPLWTVVADRYANMTLTDWGVAKWAALKQSFVAAAGPYATVWPNGQWGQRWHDRLRASDFLNFSAGNLTVLLMMVAAWAGWIRTRSSRTRSHADRAAMLLVALAIMAWALMVILFLAPMILHHWAQAGFIALALGSYVLAHRLVPRLCAAVALSAALYAVMIWLLSPLSASRDLDLFAATALLGVLISWWIVSSRSDPAPSHDTSAAALG